MNAVVIIEPVLCFFLFFCGRGHLAATLTLPVSLQKNTQFYPNFASVYAEYAVD